MDMIFKFLLEEKFVNKLIIIVGLCSVEIEEQVLIMACVFVGKGVDLFCFGIWKLWICFGVFEGIGIEGLGWLCKVKEEIGFKVIIEVVNIQYVFEVFKYQIDVFWLGVCIIVNLFFVQEVVDVLKGVDIFVLIKNFINLDFKLWVGAIECIYKVGIICIGVIYWGFSYYGEIKYCNVLCWQFVIDLKWEFFDFFIICDNSYICGCWDIL